MYPNYMIYTGSTKEEALNKASINLTLINIKFNKIASSDWADVPQELTSEPEINNEIYYYGFEAPAPQFKNGAICDLEIEYSPDWIDE